jgi:hypothetical protein
LRFLTCDPDFSSVFAQLGRESHTRMARRANVVIPNRRHSDWRSQAKNPEITASGASSSLRLRANGSRERARLQASSRAAQHQGFRMAWRLSLRLPAMDH